MCSRKAGPTAVYGDLPFVPKHAGAGYVIVSYTASSRCFLDSSVLRVTFVHLALPYPQALLRAHDTVAQRDFEPLLPPLPDNIPEGEEAMRIVCLVKNQQPLVRQPFYSSR